MKPLILSFFVVILCFSLFTNKEKEIEIKPEPELPTMNENSVYFEIQPNFQTADSVYSLRNSVAGLQ